jgi:LDH2 family malate/lactate/ureidoglycolate dehydrogenase
MPRTYGHMNNPPETAVRVPAAALEAFTAALARAGGMAQQRSAELADVLVGNDLRGNFSHGSRQVATYARLVRDGRLNGNPRLQVVRESPVSVLVDGDGGLGYFPTLQVTRTALAKALATGMATGVTRNHGHFGAAGIYARMTCHADVLCFVTSGHQLHLEPGNPLYDAAGGSPMAFSAPAAQEAPLVLDFGTMHDLYAGDGHRDQLAALAPGLVLRCIGMGEVCQVWGGFLSGLSVEPGERPWSWPGANQGSLVLVVRIDLFDDPARFRQKLDEYVRSVARLQPLEGFDRSYLPGGREEALRQEFLAQGVPVGPDHRAALEQAAAELGVTTPWAA